MEDGHFNLAFEESVPQGGGTSDFNELINRPKKDGVEMTGDTNIVIPTKTSDLTNDSDFVNQQALDTLEQELQSEIETLEGEVNGIEDVIPAQASISNQLADKAFVNSTVQTSTANFRGNWANWASVPIDATEYPADYTGTTTPSTNDYMVVQDASGYVDPTTTLAGTWRFKYTGVWATDGRNGWQPEYQVNETPMTAAQLAALNSGATTALIEQITRNEDAISALDADKQDLLTAGDNITISNNEISADVPELLATTGQSTTAGMTQKAITDALASAGGVKVLTADDYNYPASNPTSVAIWKLEPGIYYTDKDNGISVNYGAGQGTSSYDSSSTFIVGGENSSSDRRKWVIWLPGGYSVPYFLKYRNLSDGSGDYLIVPNGVKNNLTTTSSDSALDARQGKVLKDMIGNLADLDTTDKSNLVAAINEVAGGAGGGGVKVLTTADYNYPASNPNGVALWLLDAGLYQGQVKAYKAPNSSFGTGGTFVVMKEGTDTQVLKIDGQKLSYWKSYSNGQMAQENEALNKSSIIENLTTTYSGYALGANQGKVLKDLYDALEARVRALEGNA